MAVAEPTSYEMALRGRIGAFELHARHDAHQTTAARAAFLQSFEHRVDPKGTLPPSERARRAEYARKAHMARLALASARKRRRGAASAPEPAGARS